MEKMITVLKDSKEILLGGQLYELFERTEITQCKQCNRVHTRKGDVCQECENHNAIHEVKKVDDQSEGI